MQSIFNNNTVYTIKNNSIRNDVSDVLENVPFMDSKNISEMVCNQYVDHELKCSKTFLEYFLTHIASIFDHSLFLNRNLDTLYIPSIPDLNDDESFFEALNETFGHYISKNDLSYMEQYLVVQFNHFLNFICEEMNEDWNTIYSLFKEDERYKNNIDMFDNKSELHISTWTDFLQIKIQQPILLINPDLLNTDRRSTRSTNYLYNFDNNQNDKNPEFMYEIGKRIEAKFDIFSEDGFTVLEYLIHFLTIRGNPLDRWYTMYCGMNDRSTFKPGKHGYKNVVEFEKKYLQLVKNNEIKGDYITLYFSFDHGS